MHEMAIAEGILEIALDYAQKNDAVRIERIGLLLGELSGVETDALTWERVPLMGRCHDCGRELRIRLQDYLCPDCGGGMEIIGGREMRVDFIEME